MKYNNRFNLPNCIVDALTADTYDFKPNADRISVTSLIQPPKKTLLTRRHWDEIEVDVSDEVWKLIGSSVHEVMARALTGTGHRVIEQRQEVEIGGMVVSGKNDLYDFDDRTLYDFKVTSVWSVIYKSSMESWTNQLNVLDYIKTKKLDGYDAESLKIIAILRDWSRKKRNEENYPYIPLVVIDVPRWTTEQQEQYILNRIAEYRESQLLEDDAIPECPPSERWRDPDVYAVYKNTNKKALKLCETMSDAEQFVEYLKRPLRTELEDGSVVMRPISSADFFIRHRKPLDKRCLDFCSTRSFCSYYNKYAKKDADVMDATQEV